ncbi:Helicase required for RNAi-mediated heterochromatin assembly 1 [Colletotrichum sp. SAR11_59]|nr:Helicase required for RNAi-mediated heterochromatin assembly 1 [Colletotrichum sp. SAR11_59]
MAHELIEQDASVAQDVIKEMASSRRLPLIKEALELLSTSATLREKTSLLKRRIHPLFVIVTHSSIVGSVVVEQEVAQIYRVFLGVNATRLKLLFDFIVHIIDHWAEIPWRDETVSSMETISLSCGVLARVIETSTFNMINEHVVSIVKEIQLRLEVFGAGGDTFHSVQASRSLEYVRRRLDIGRSLPDVSHVPTSTSAMAEFTLSQDFPGNLSRNGKRHDNDHADIKDIKLMPTHKEIMSSREEYLPTTNPYQHHLQGLRGFLDRQFRLLREDTLHDLREAIRTSVETNSKVRGVRTKVVIYEQATPVDVSFEQWSGLEFIVRFDQPRAARALDKTDRAAWWMHNKRLVDSALVCVLDEAGSVLFFQVSRSTNRTTRNHDLHGQQDKDDEEEPYYSLPEDRQHAFVYLRLVETDTDSVKSSLLWFKTGVTGKSYTGEELIKVLLANKSKAKLGPIICVCYTNHALDQLLEHLIDGKVRNIIRIGSRSKSDRLQSVNLREVVKGITRTAAEMGAFHDTREDLHMETTEVIDELEHYQQINVNRQIKDFLAGNHRDHYEELFGQLQSLDEIDEGYEVVNYNRKNSLSRWLHGGWNINTPDRPLSALYQGRLSAMNHRERVIIYRDWARQALDRDLDLLSALHDIYDKGRQRNDRVRSATDLRCLQQANIIGVTTTGLARNLDLLRRVQSKVLLCEEAGEVLEAHLVTALLPTIEHAILIGDHLQLRPQIQDWRLQRANPAGVKYSLDVSLFERLELGSSMQIVVNERDLDDLANINSSDPTTQVVQKMSAAKSSTLNGVRVATVDNFQGEEADVVIVSLVRSNNERRCGFLSTSNRINVLLSRARHGMYIIGNAHTASSVAMWDEKRHAPPVARTPSATCRPSVCGETCPDMRYCQECAADEIKQRVVDLVMMDDYCAVDLDEDPCIFPDCGHFWTCSTMDGQMGLRDFYAVSDEGIPIALKGDSQPFTVTNIKACPDCRGSLRNISRYGRIVRRGILDESTKKFIDWSNRKWKELSEAFLTAQERLQSKDLRHFSFPISREQGYDLRGPRQEQIDQVFKLTSGARHLEIKLIRRRILHFLDQVRKDEQPYQRVANLVRHVNNRRRQIENFSFDESVIQLGSHLQATTLLLQCDLLIVSDYLSICRKSKGGTAKSVKVDPIPYIKDCFEVIKTASAKVLVRQEIEARIFVGMFSSFIPPPTRFETEEDKGEGEGRLKSLKAKQKIRQIGIKHLEGAQEQIRDNPSVSALQSEYETAWRMLHDGVFYSDVSNDELRSVYKAMSKEFGGTGHWYYCVNMHPFTIGECGMAMETARCPECGEPVGGQSHQFAEGVQRANDIEEVGSNRRRVNLDRTL